uniref:Fork-head domain-containing protein n=1 Tax=Mycena chlorophos TaxID=658473 RepID=A0ABQ0LB20_MYCCL|nr:predicted protein [Mycena chlorophos]
MDDSPTNALPPDDDLPRTPDNDDRPGSSHSSNPNSPNPRRRLTGPFYLQNILNEDDERKREAALRAEGSSSASPATSSAFSPLSPVAGPSRGDDHGTFVYSHPPPPPPGYPHTQTQYAHIAPSPHPPAGVYIHPHPHAMNMYPRSRIEADADYLRRQLCLAPSVNVDLWAIADPPDGQKPFASLPTLIKLAIHGDPKKKLTLQGICEALVNRFAWFNEHQMDDAWKNSVRHNLSLNKVFRKVPRDAKQMGKGCYWELDLSGGEGHKRPRKRRKHDKATGTMVSAIQSTRASTTVQIPYGVSREVAYGPGAVPQQMLHHGPIASGSNNMMGRLVSARSPANAGLGRLVVPRLRPVKMEGDDDSEMEVESEEDDNDELEDEEEDELDADPAEHHHHYQSTRMDVDDQQDDDEDDDQQDDDDDDPESEEAIDAPYRPRTRAPPPALPGEHGGRVMRPRHARSQSDNSQSTSGGPSRRPARSARSAASSSPKTGRRAGAAHRSRGGLGRSIASPPPAPFVSVSAPGLEALSAEAMRRMDSAASTPPPSASTVYSHPPPPPPPLTPQMLPSPDGERDREHDELDGRRDSSNGSSAEPDLPPLAFKREPSTD